MAACPSGRHRLFVIDEASGEGPGPAAPGRGIAQGSRNDHSATITFFHGFPTSSFDWHRVLDLLDGDIGDLGADDGSGAMRPAQTQPTSSAQPHRRVLIDHLGFGASDKPRGHTYTIDEQVDLVCSVWDRLDVVDTHLVVHDYSVSLAQEILARILDDAWTGPHIRSMLMFNGGLFPGTYRPLGIQRLLLHPRWGPWVARLSSRATLARSFRRIHAPSRPPRDEDLDAQWAMLRANGGRQAIPALSQYQLERIEQADRWRAAIADTDVPLRFAWGLADPISGEVVDELHTLRPDLPLLTWDDVGHYPMLEAPDRVARSIADTCFAKS